MFERLKRLYKAHKITAEGLRYWVEKGAITQEEMNLILEENGDEDEIEKDKNYYIEHVRNGMDIEEVPAEYRDAVKIACGLEG